LDIIFKVIMEINRKSSEKKWVSL